MTSSQPSQSGSDWIGAAVNKAAWDLAAQREAVLREVVRERLPKPLRWACDHPRVLRVLYRLRPALRPTITYGFDGGNGVAVTTTEDGTFVIVEQFRIDD
jgi:hypothetical protein